MWSNRLMAELPYWKSAAFITLTYEDIFLPYSLRFCDLQKYFKRLRRDLDGRKIKYYACGEYGTRGGLVTVGELEGRFVHRPHFHAIVFGVDPYEDREVIKENWPYADWNELERTKRGRKAIADVTFGSVHYVAGYVQKKLVGEMAKEVYERDGRVPPDVRMSKGLGLKFVEDNKDLLRRDLMFSYGGYTVALPKYMRDKLGVTPQEMSDRHFYRVLDDEKFREWASKRKWLGGIDNAVNAYSATKVYKENLSSSQQREKDLKALNEMYQRDIV